MPSPKLTAATYTFRPGQTALMRACSHSAPKQVRIYLLLECLIPSSLVCGETALNNKRQNKRQRQATKK